MTIADADTPVVFLTVAATSSNQAVVPDANLTLTGRGAARNLKFIPAGVGYSTITITVSDGALSGSYVINSAASGASQTPAATVFHTGKADAFTAIAIDNDYMLVADDEDQTIRLYDRNESGLPLNSFDFTASLGLTVISGGAPREVDIEASAQNGNRIYRLASHSNSSGGNNCPNRSRLFAADLSGAGASATLSYVGRYDNLKTDLIIWDANNLHGLGANYFGLQASAATGVIPEEPGGAGFNIEGLVFAPDNTTAYVCFRAPIVPAANRARALIVPVANFRALVAGNPSAGPAVFGAPIELNLGGRGIREIKKNAAGEYLIVAGAAGGNFRLYRWSGNPMDAPALLSADLTGLNPESIVDFPIGLNNFAPVSVQLLCDNGDDVYYGDGVIAKDLPSNEFKKFRSDVVTVSLASPTAASASVRGRVLNSGQRSVAGARVSMTDPAGATRTVLTNSFGHFTFADVPVGATYIFQVSSKRYVFAPQPVTVTDEVSELNFVGN